MIETRSPLEMVIRCRLVCHRSFVGVLRCLRTPVIALLALTVMIVRHDELKEYAGTGLRGYRIFHIHECFVNDVSTAVELHLVSLQCRRPV